MRSEPKGLRQAIRDTAYAQPRYGIRRVHWWVRQQGFEAGRRRVQRIYREEGLVVRKRRRKRLKVVVRRPMTVPTGPTQRWSVDCVHDKLCDGRRFRVFNVVDDFSRQSVASYAATALPSCIATRALELAFESYGKPGALVCDNGPEFTCLHFLQWRPGIASTYGTSTLANRFKTRSAKASTATCGANASTPNGLKACGTLAP